MVSIKPELEVIKLLEEQLEIRKIDELNHQLAHIKNLAHNIELMIEAGENDCDVHKATDILCKYLGMMWEDIYYIKK